MNRNRLVIGLAVALVVGFFAARYVYVQLQNARAVKAAPASPRRLARNPQLGSFEKE